MFYFDAHNHLCNCRYPEFDIDDEYFCISNFCTDIEWNNFKHHDKQNVLKSFGIHPQMFVDDSINFEKQIEFLENLLKENKIFAIGEIGFDFFTEEFKNTKELQEKYWNKQIDLAIKYEKPIIIHARKSMEQIFAESEKLKKLSAVIFHSFAGTKNDANSLLNKNINAFFSFGKHQIFNQKKASIEILKNANDFKSRILLETDAPYQTLKNEARTKAEDIKLVYKEASRITVFDMFEITKASLEKLYISLGSNKFSSIKTLHS